MIFSCVGRPDNISGGKIQKLSEEISLQCNSIKALEFEPHFSIMGDFEVLNENVPSFIAEMELKAKLFSKFHLNLWKFGFYPWKIIFLEIEKDDRLVVLHQEFMDVIQNFRTAWIPDHLTKTTHFSGQQGKYILKYGYQFAYEYYSPHFTLAGNDMSDEKFEEIKSKYKNLDFNIVSKIKSVALLDREKNNSISKEFELSDL